MQWLLTYRSVDGFEPIAAQHGAEHVARLHEFHDRGLLLAAGPLGEPPNGDAVSVFTTRQAAEEFVAGDPFVGHGVVDAWTLRPWHNAFG